MNINQALNQVIADILSAPRGIELLISEIVALKDRCRALEASTQELKIELAKERKRRLKK